MSLRSCHCCQEPGRVFVWIVSAMTVTKVVEGCVYIRRRYYGILPHVGGEFELSANSPISLVLSSNATTLNHLIRLRGSQGIQIWKQRTHRTRLFTICKALTRRTIPCVWACVYLGCDSWQTDNRRTWYSLRHQLAQLMRDQRRKPEAHHIVARMAHLATDLA